MLNKIQTHDIIYIEIWKYFLKKKRISFQYLGGDH